MTELDQRPTTDTAEAAPAGPSRRQVLLTGGVVVAAAAVTAACGSSSSGGGASSASPAGSSSSASTPSESASSSASEDSGGGTKVAAADVPVGGGVILADKKVVVTQPAKGEFKAFSAVCTHQGCAVASVANGVIVCPCHGSQFSISDGSVKGGPAPSPLGTVAVSVDGDQVTVSA
ncbi:MAG: Rieske (2Fe-2S) protein [Candidatus Nanopelagicales bacterium]